jgi:PIN domain nuclease of toxin-antitoxin system
VRNGTRRKAFFTWAKMSTEAGALLLDTHVWIWLSEGVPELSVERRHSIEDAARRGEVWVSIISVWEVSSLHSKRRLHLGTSCLEWARRALAPPLALATLTPEIAVECNSLPGQFHDDPADRMIAATARLEDMTVLTRDRQILAYAAQGHVDALPW